MLTHSKTLLLVSPLMLGLAACGSSDTSVITSPQTEIPLVKTLNVPGSGWVQTFVEEFNGTSLDTSKWSASRARANANNWEASCWGNVLTENATVSSGSLHLKLDNHAPITCQNPPTAWASGSSQTFNTSTGEVTTLGKFSQQYGYFEARVKSTGVNLLSSAFWLLPNDDIGGGLYSPEIDITENDTRGEPTKTALMSWWGYSPRTSGGPNFNNSQETIYQGPNFSQDYHVYGLNWMPDRMEFYVDDVLRATHTQGMSSFNKPMYILLQTVANQSITTPHYYDVDYVRVWQRNDQIGHWTFSEGSGTRSVDSSGRKNHATLSNNGWTNWGLNGNGSNESDGDHAPIFNGSSTYANVGNASALNINGNLTASAWVWIDTVGSERVVVGKGWDGSSTPFWLSLLNDNTVRFGHFGPNLVVADGVAGGSLVNTGWHHLVGTYDGSAYRVYIDGQQKASTPSSQGITTGSNSVNIGRINENGGGKYFDGVIDEVSLYNRALSAQEVLALYNTRR